MFFFIRPYSFYHIILLSILNRFRRQFPRTSVSLLYSVTH
ncbi:hypothetical protein UVUMRFZT_CDS0133 [Staphylococcus phage LJLAME001]|uniref:Uncharacterized protein n=1 Tax=Staphylococcus phage 184DA TaxID=3110532 RepID=A0AAU6MXC7_9CAUD